MDGTWIEVRVITKSEALEPVSGIFYSLDCKGVAIEDPEDILGREQGPLTWDFADINVLEHKGKFAVVKAYFAEEDNIEEILGYVNEKLVELKEMGIDLGEAKVEHEKMYEEDWANTWKQYYKPSKVGEKIVVKPIWEEYEQKEGELVVNLDPGMAFGTGTHPTTNLTLQALEVVLRGGETVLDVGTGSGVLSIASKYFGAEHVYAYDLDDVAVAAAKENMDMNPIAKDVHVAANDLLTGVDITADVIVANILADIIVLLTKDAARLLKANGRLIISGIITEKKAMVLENMHAHGFEVEQVFTQKDWHAIILKKAEEDDATLLSE